VEGGKTGRGGRYPILRGRSKKERKGGRDTVSCGRGKKKRKRKLENHKKKKKGLLVSLEKKEGGKGPLPGRGTTKIHFLADGEEKKKGKKGDSPGNVKVGEKKKKPGVGKRGFHRIYRKKGSESHRQKKKREKRGGEEGRGGKRRLTLPLIFGGGKKKTTPLPHRTEKGERKGDIGRKKKPIHIIPFIQ